MLALLLGVSNIGLTWYFHSTETAVKNSDDHTNVLIDAKLGSATEKMHNDLKEQLAPISGQFKDLSDKLGALDGRVTKLEGRFDQLNEDQKRAQRLQLDISIRENITEYALAKPDDLKRDLPKVGSTLQTASKHKVKVTAPVLSDLQKGLNAIAPSTPGYWPTAAEFIGYRSQVNVGADFQTLSRPDMPNCTDKPPTPMELNIGAEDEKNVPVGGATTEDSTFTAAVYENCRFTLDSPEEAAKIPYVQEGRAIILRFKNCQIIYRGGPIAILSLHPRPTAITGKGPTRTDVYIVTGQRFYFENCLFLFSINTVPPKAGQSLTSQLLAQSGLNIRITLM